MEPFGGEPPHTPSRKQVQLQGPRPTALQINQESHKIKKPPRPPIRQNPVIIYAVSPKIIHTEVSDFMSVVQRLTGLSSGDFSNDGSVSPAARLAATERASPRDRIITNCLVQEHANETSDIMQIVEGLEMDIAQVPGVLSPAPAMLPPVPPGFFSPASDPLAFISEMSPWNNIGSSSSFMASPSALLQPHMLSPMISPDIFNSLFADFL